mmetsp:Transcript_89081/g.232280  ORF Transcript_89081/g.232280 Transcript_89081/m.232280 type:complete len:251 (+) Transcript_89081:196-948(+)
MLPTWCWRLRTTPSTGLNLALASSASTPGATPTAHQWAQCRLPTSSRPFAPAGLALAPSCCRTSWLPPQPLLVLLVRRRSLASLVWRRCFAWCAELAVTGSRGPRVAAAPVPGQRSADAQLCLAATSCIHAASTASSSCATPMQPTAAAAVIRRRRRWPYTSATSRATSLASLRPRPPKIVRRFAALRRCSTPCSPTDVRLLAPGPKALADPSSVAWLLLQCGPAPFDNIACLRVRACSGGLTTGTAKAW